MTKQPSLPIRRRIGVLLLLLPAGAVINVAVAWSVVLKEPRDSRPFPPAVLMRESNTPNSPLYNKREMRTLVIECSGSLEICQSMISVQALDNLPFIVRWVDEHAYQDLLPVNSRFRNADPVLQYPLRTNAHPEEWMMFSERSTGWPCLSMMQYHVQHGLGDVSGRFEENGLRLDRYFEGDFRSLPVHPIPDGFTINTLFYAVILWGGWLLFWRGRFVIRTWRRRRKGLCPACAYPVGTNAVCTECGFQLLYS